MDSKEFTLDSDDGTILNFARIEEFMVYLDKRIIALEQVGCACKKNAPEPRAKKLEREYEEKFTDFGRLVWDVAKSQGFTDTKDLAISLGYQHGNMYPYLRSQHKVTDEHFLRLWDLCRFGVDLSQMDLHTMMVNDYNNARALSVLGKNIRNIVSADMVEPDISATATEDAAPAAAKEEEECVHPTLFDDTSYTADTEPIGAPV